MSEPAAPSRHDAWRQARPSGPVVTLPSGLQGWDAGAAAVDAAVDSGAGVLLLCDERALDSDARAIAALLCGGDATAVMTASDDALAWMQECGRVRDAMARLRPSLADLATLLAAAPALASDAAAMVRAAARRTPIVIAGPVAEVAGVAALRVASHTRGWVSTALADADAAAAQARRRSGAEAWASVAWRLPQPTMQSLVTALVADLDGDEAPA